MRFMVFTASYANGGAGGQRYLAVRLVLMALIIQILITYQERYFYPPLPAAVNGAALYRHQPVRDFYLANNYQDIAIWRQAVTTVTTLSSARRSFC